jgi:hypothetical protein
MGKTREKAPGVKRKGKHSNDANRSNKGNKDGVRDAATVREIKTFANSAVDCGVEPLKTLIC